MTTAGSWSLRKADLEALDRVLGSFVTEAKARCALLVDRTGRAITAAGQTGDLDQTAFASLAAADFAASDQLARLLGEAEFASLYHAGSSHSMYLADVGGHAILAALFDAKTTLGLVRLRSRAIIPRMTEVLAEVSTRPAEPISGPGKDDGWLEAAADEIDRLFNKRSRPMSMINYASREINCKLVYYGPGLGGKTTNIEYVYNKVNPDTRGKLISLATEQERTLFFDFLPVDLGSIRGFKTRFHLYTVPGQVYYNASRRLILKGVDGVVFVSDSQPERMDANIASMQNLYENLAEYGYDPTTLPLVIQYNKRDVPAAVPVQELRVQINPDNLPDFEAVAISGQGVFDTLKAVSKMVLKTLG